MNTHTGLQVIDTALLRHRLPSCSANDTELGPCTQWCGRDICSMRSTCVRPTVAVKRPLWGQLKRWARIRRARSDLQYLEHQYRQMAGSRQYQPHQLQFIRDQVGAARVDLALAQRR